MSYQKSFVDIGNKHWSEFKKNLSLSESVLDTKKLFSKAVAQLFSEIEPGLKVTFGEFESDFSLTDTDYSISSKISENELFKALDISSDLSSIIKRYSQAALDRVAHQEKLPKEQNVKKIQH